ncbi:MAG: nuclear transport factor 2 family protein [Cyclobacteriaceae bacterium]
MRQKIYALILIGFLTFGVSGFSFSQDLSFVLIDKIEKEITQLFDKSIRAGEKLDIKGITENIDDTLKTGFIDNGFYFKSFEELMVGFKSGIQGLEYQKMNVETKKITVLSENNALLTAHGNYSTKVNDGRILTGKFAWTFVYSKINGKWKVIHSHMSNPTLP